MKKFFVFLIPFMFVTLAYWAIGFNFDKRGADLFQWWIVASGFGGFCLLVFLANQDIKK